MQKLRGKLRSDEVGFGLVELIVAMTLMAIVLMALAPFLVNSFKATARNVRIAGATELVNQRIDLAQSRPNTASCEAFHKFIAEHVGVPGAINEVEDLRRSITYEISMAHNFDLATCKATLAADAASSFYFTAVVSDQKDGNQLAQAKTWIAVPGFSS